MALQDGWSVTDAWLAGYSNLAQTYKYGCKIPGGGQFRWKAPLSSDPTKTQLPNGRWHVSDTVYSNEVQMNQWRKVPYEGADSGHTLLDKILK